MRAAHDALVWTRLVVAVDHDDDLARAEPSGPTTACYTWPRRLPAAAAASGSPWRREGLGHNNSSPSSIAFAPCACRPELRTMRGRSSDDRSNCSAMVGKMMTLKSPAATSAAALGGLMACS